MKLCKNWKLMVIHILGIVFILGFIVLEFI
jgi:hypothetical protein